MNSKDYALSVSTFKGKGKHSHLLGFTLNSKMPKPGKCDLKVALKKRLPSWIIQCTDEEGLDIHEGDAMTQTYGLRYLLRESMKLSPRMITTTLRN